MLWANGPMADDVKQGHAWMHEHPFNVGQHIAHNEMLDQCMTRNYDYHIRVDDDCWIAGKKWLSKLLRLFDKAATMKYGRLCLSMAIDGLDNPPPTVEKLWIGGTLVEHVEILGGIFRMTPMGIMRYFRWDERLPMGMGEARQFSHFCGGLNVHLLRATNVHATHGESTRKQEENTAWAHEHAMLQSIPSGL